MSELSLEEIKKLFNIEVNEVRVEFKGRQNSANQGLGGVTIARFVPKTDQHEVRQLKTDDTSE